MFNGKGIENPIVTVWTRTFLWVISKYSYMKKYTLRKHKHQKILKFKKKGGDLISKSPLCLTHCTMNPVTS